MNKKSTKILIGAGLLVLFLLAGIGIGTIISGGSKNNGKDTVSDKAINTVKEDSAIDNVKETSNVKDGDAEDINDTEKNVVDAEKEDITQSHGSGDSKLKDNAEKSDEKDNVDANPEDKDTGDKESDNINSEDKNSGSKDSYGDKKSEGRVSENKDSGGKNSDVDKESADINSENNDSGGKNTDADKESSDINSEDKDSGSKNSDADKESADINSEDKDSGDKDSKGNESVTQDGYTLTFSTDNSWNNGNVTMYGVQFGITNGNSSTVSGWNLEMEIEGLSGDIDGWNGTYTVKGNILSVKNANYNADIYSNGQIVIGCNLGTTAGKLNIKSAKLNGKAMKIVGGKVDQNRQNNNPGNNTGNGGNSGNGNNGGSTGGNDKINDSVDVSELLKRNDKAKQGDDWLHTDGRNILDKNGKKVWLTGVNWFGYNTGTNTFDGLWNSKLVPTVKAIADHGFNLIRVPISAELINQWSKGEYPKANYNNAYNTELNSMNSLEIWEYFLSLAEANGIKVMPDIHSAETNASGHNVNLWCTDKVKVNDFYHALEWMAERYKNNDTIIAYDLKNEPHGKPYEGSNAAIWNDSKSANNWKYVAETAAAKILAKNPNVLIMVEGIEIYPMDLKNNSDYHSTNDKDYFFNWWGGNLRGVKDYPVDLGKYRDKLVYSPHDYGPTVFAQPWFEKDYDFNSLMKDCWRDNWFYIYEDNIAPLLIGEWGGFMTKPNITWMTYMRKLIKDNHLNHTFWCLNANSGDTGGLLLDDFTTWDTEKYNFVKEVLWQENGKFVGLDHEIPLGDNGINCSKATGLK